MNERELGGKWLKQYQMDHPEAFVYRISDSPVMRKPFDAFVHTNGRGIAIEFKMDGEKLMPHQKKALREFTKSGGTSCVIYFTKDGAYRETIFLG